MLEYTASPGLGVYTYRLHNVPMYVPPGHGLVYLAALCIGRSVLAERYRKQFIYGVLVVCGAWAFWGLALAPRRDVLGAIMYLFLVRFLLVGRQPLVYAGAFVVTSYLELVGTNLGAWTWAVHGPGGIIPQGNPPSGIPGGYCFLDAAGLALAPLCYWGSTGCREVYGGRRRGRRWMNRSELEQVLELAERRDAVAEELERVRQLEVEIERDVAVELAVPDLIAVVEQRTAAIAAIARELEREWSAQGPLVLLWTRAAEQLQQAESAGVDPEPYRAEVAAAERRVEAARLADA